MMLSIMLVILGGLLVIIGFITIVVVIKNSDKLSVKIINKELADYDEDEILPEKLAEDTLMRAIVSPVNRALVGAIIMFVGCICVFIATFIEKYL